MTHLAGAWLSNWAQKPDAQVRLFCLPFAGAGASYYYSWARALADTPIELAAVQLPGRENRCNEPAFRSMPLLIEALSDALMPSLDDRPVWLFGHSMGALLAFELARALRERARSEPAHLFVSGAKAPPHLKPFERLHELPDAAFVRVMAERYQGIPPAVLANRDLLALMLPALRADMTMIETYEYRESAPLACDISALGGDRDPHADASALEGWRDVTTGTVTCRTFSGGHSYLSDARADVVQMFRDRLAGLARALPLTDASAILSATPRRTHDGKRTDGDAGSQ